MHECKTAAVYKFLTLRQVLSFFEARGVDLNTVRIEGAFCGSDPREDDIPVFTWGKQ
jgi:hypothetical protein